MSYVKKQYKSLSGSVFREYNDKKTMQVEGELEENVLDFAYVSDRKRVELKCKLEKIKDEKKSPKVLIELVEEGRREKFDGKSGKVFYVVYEDYGDKIRWGGGWSSEIVEVK